MFPGLYKSRFKVFVFLLLLTVLCLVLKIRSALLSFYFQYVCLLFPINYIFRKLSKRRDDNYQNNFPQKKLAA